MTRLAALHTVLSSRLASHDRLLALSGRLELVLAQIELRTAYAAEAAARAPVQGLKTKQRTAAAPKPVREAGRWVEGSSDEESDGEAAEGASDEELDDEADEVDVIGQASDDDDDASVEDVALGASTSMGATSGESDEEEENDEDDSEAGSDVDMADAAEGSAEEEEEEESDDPDALEDGEDESELDDDSDEVVSRPPAWPAHGLLITRIRCRTRRRMTMRTPTRARAAGCSISRRRRTPRRSQKKSRRLGASCPPILLHVPPHCPTGPAHIAPRNSASSSALSSLTPRPHTKKTMAVTRNSRHIVGITSLAGVRQAGRE